MSSRHAIQNTICIINPGGDKSSQRQWYCWLNDQVCQKYALGHECDTNRILTQPWHTWVKHSTEYFDLVREWN